MSYLTKFRERFGQHLDEELTPQVREQRNLQAKRYNDLMKSVAPMVFGFIEYAIVLAILSYGWSQASGWDRVLLGVVIGLACGSLWIYFMSALPEEPTPKRMRELFHMRTVYRMLGSLALSAFLALVVWRLVVVFEAIQFPAN